MIRDDQLPELQAFREVERNLPLWYTPAFAGLVVSSQNENHPVHNWFRFKEGFSLELLRSILPTISLPNRRELRLLDPFCGVGTTLLAGQELASAEHRFASTGIEINPFIHFAANTKLAWSRIRERRMLSLGQEALARAASFHSELPQLSSIFEGRCIGVETAERIVSLRDAIQSLGKSPETDALLLGLAASIEPLSNVRKDGRALRLVDRKAPPFVQTVQDRWESMAADVAERRRHVGVSEIATAVRGDGRHLPLAGIKRQSIDLIVTSPPYPNNIDYSEVYKLELWFLKFVTSAEQFLALRRLTLRSHPTASPLSPGTQFAEAIRHQPLSVLFEPLLERVSLSTDKWRKRLLIGYFSDLFEALQNHYAYLRPGGYEILVVGNSLHGGASNPYLIPTDLALALTARLLGFQVQQVMIARNLKRRLAGNHFLRESVLILRKPHE